MRNKLSFHFSFDFDTDFNVRESELKFHIKILY